MKKIFEADIQTETYNDAFNALLRGKRPTTDQQRTLNLGEVQHNVYRLPADADRKFTNTRNQRSVLRPLCTCITVSQGDNRVLVSQRDSSAEWLLPGAQYPEVEGSFTQIRSTPKKLGCTSTISADVVSDGLFDLSDYLMDSWGRRFAQAEDAGILAGTGSDGELNGLTQQAQQMTISELSYSALLEVYFSVDSECRDSATWILNDTLYLLVRSLVDGNNRPLLDISSSGETLLGRPVRVSVGAPDDKLFFGSMSHVWVLDRSPLMVSVLSELYAAQNQVGFRGWELVDSVLTRPEAVVCATIGTETTDTEDEDAE